ncbi:MAG: hypothetical protein H6509_06505 [Bryobacterales bacterium]|nr:hypothetical protein [Acidobacteriota bacterium]MCB9384246.1 hypothetical protein [Bryobacterales bacterium]
MSVQQIRPSASITESDVDTVRSVRSSILQQRRLLGRKCNDILERLAAGVPVDANVSVSTKRVDLAEGYEEYLLFDDQPVYVRRVEGRET